MSASALAYFLLNRFSTYSLRSGVVTEAGRQGVPLGEVMAMTEHRSVTTVRGYFQAGALLESRASRLMGEPSPDEPMRETSLAEGQSGNDDL